MSKIYADFYVEQKSDNKWYVRAVTRFIEDDEQETKRDEFLSEPYETEEEADKRRLEMVSLTENFRLHAAAQKHPKN